MNLKQEIIALKKRNQKVEIDKAWETSWVRKILISVLTYFVIVLFFLSVKIENPFVNAIVPTLGFILSTFSLEFFKNIWKKYCYKK